MEETSERIDFDENRTDIALQEHIVRYMLAKDYITNKDVLDIACGTGYGTYYLSKYCNRIVGLDISEEAVRSAKKKYKNKNLLFFKKDAISTGFDDKSFDVVVSFETIEHIENQDAFLREIKRVLKEDGILIMSCPNIEFSKKNNLHNKFHFREYTYRITLSDGHRHVVVTTNSAFVPQSGTSA